MGSLGGSKQFFEELQENETYYNVSLRKEAFADLQSSRAHIRGVDWELNSIKQNNPLHREDEVLMELKRKARPLQNKITEREQELNHNKSK